MSPRARAAAVAAMVAVCLLSAPLAAEEPDPFIDEDEAGANGGQLGEALLSELIGTITGRSSTGSQTPHLAVESDCCGDPPLEISTDGLRLGPSSFTITVSTAQGASSGFGIGGLPD